MTFNVDRQHDQQQRDNCTVLEIGTGKEAATPKQKTRQEVKYISNERLSETLAEKVIKNCIVTIKNLTPRESVKRRKYK